MDTYRRTTKGDEVTTDPRDGFTPGPWEPFNDYAPGVMTPWDVIAPGPCITIARNVGEANAHLIASAPALLADNERQAKVIEAMVKALRRARNTILSYPGYISESEQDVLTSIDAALSLADQKGNEHGT